MLILLCVTEISSWGILYYAFPVLAPGISASTGWPLAAVTTGLTVGLLTAAIGGIPIGRWLDRSGPRPVMTVAAVLAVPALAGVALAPGLGWFLLAWVPVGGAMAGLLYPPAFAALTRWYGPDRVPALTTLTLVGGLASTVFAPLTGQLAAHLSWRQVYLVLAVLLGALTIPAHLWGLRLPWVEADAGPHREPAAPPTRSLRTDPGSDPTAGGQTGPGVDAARSPRAGAGSPGAPAAVGPPSGPAEIARSRAFRVLVVVIGVASFATYAVVINQVPLLRERGASGDVAAIALGLGGIGQVAGRLGYPRLIARTTVRSRTLLILVAGTVTTGLLGLVPGPTVLLVAGAVLAGVTRGVFTLLQATAVSERWGTAHYGRLNGLLSTPSMLAAAVAPAAGAGLAGLFGGYPAVFAVLTALIGLAALAGGATVPTSGARFEGSSTDR
ncbi:MAG: MFS transporter [Actinocatenispora sp.]